VAIEVGNGRGNATIMVRCGIAGPRTAAIRRTPDHRLEVRDNYGI